MTAVAPTITTTEPRHLPLLTVSQMKSFRSCHRKHHFAYNLGVRPVERPLPLRFGTLVHRALEAWWLPSGATAAVPAGDARLAAALAVLAAAVDEDPFDVLRAEELMRGYHLRWIDDADAYETIAVEQQFRAPLVNPETGAPSRTFELGGKSDVIVRERRSSRMLLVEHKTSTEDIGPGSEYWRRLTLDGQVSTYLVGARALGYPVEGCLYDVLARPRMQQLKATPEDARKYTKAGTLYANQRAEDETPDDFRARLRGRIAEAPDDFYQRGIIVRLEDEERDAAFDTWQTARLIREAQLAGRHPRNPDSCTQWGRTCAYFDVCTGAASLDDASRFRHVERVHEELA